MSMIEVLYKTCARPVIFRKSAEDAETAHEWGLKRLRTLQENRFMTWLSRKFLVYSHPMLRTTIFGLDFPNPFGLAAGFDKYCEVYWGAVPSCGWGFCDVGGITRYEQSGNDRPRMRRSLELHALWNFMGFNNPGADKAAGVMAHYPRPRIPVGLNVGKSKLTPLEEAPADYVYTIRKLREYVDFIVLNPSSPNTPGLRSLQGAERLRELVKAAQQATSWIQPRRPVGVKISPDETDEVLSDIVQVCREEKVDFIEATNTTLSREDCNRWGIPPDYGGVSGSPLYERALRVLVDLRCELKGEIPLIGVGGIRDGTGLFERIIHGANLCRAFTGWPFEGPDFPKRCLQTLVKLLKLHGFRNVSAAVGAAI